MKTLCTILIFTLILVCCTKKQGKNPALAFTDLSLLDSCSQPGSQYYKNDAVTLHSGAHGPHGTFRLRFNKIAFKALSDHGKLPQGTVFPNGSLLIKDVYSGPDLALYAYMYKRSGSWLWGEIRPDKEVLYSVNKNPSLCINCHSQAGNRDLAVSFNFY